MEREEVLRLAREAGAEFRCDTLLVNGKDADDFIEHFAALVAAAEREVCIDAADAARRSLSERYGANIEAKCSETGGNMDWARLDGAVKVVQAIRARTK